MGDKQANQVSPALEKASSPGSILQMFTVIGRGWRENADGLSGWIILMKMTVKCLTLDYDSVFLQSLELVVFKRRRNGAICSELALALRNLSLGTAMQELIQGGVRVGVANVLLNVQIFTLDDPRSGGIENAASHWRGEGVKLARISLPWGRQVWGRIFSSHRAPHPTCNGQWRNNSDCEQKEQRIRLLPRLTHRRGRGPGKQLTRAISPVLANQWGMGCLGPD